MSTDTLAMTDPCELHEQETRKYHHEHYQDGLADSSGRQHNVSSACDVK